MIRLGLSSQPEWVKIDRDARFLVAPIGQAMVAAARKAVPPPKEGEHRSAEQKWVEFMLALATLAIIDWEGIGDADGQPIALREADPEQRRDLILGLVDMPPVFRIFEAHAGRWLVLVPEKNVSAPSPIGTSAVAETTVQTARTTARTALPG